MEESKKELHPMECDLKDGRGRVSSFKGRSKKRKAEALEDEAGQSDASD